MEKEQPLIRISVRNLVEFILRSGDIDNRIAAADKDAMLLGGKIHRKIQRRMGADYHAEVTLKYEVPCKGFILSVEGRADGIIDTPSGIVIDEITGVLKDLDMIKEPVAVHLAQAKCYAYIYASQKKLEEIGVQMTYCNMETEEIKRFQNGSVNMRNGQGIRFDGRKNEMHRLKRLDFRLHIERDSAILQLPYIERFLERRSYSFKRRQE